ncbi:MAG: hypothetical protein ACP5IL_05590 [Syntrophobacteraceae bacterium]
MGEKTVEKQMIDLQRIGMEGMIDFAATFWNQSGKLLNWFLNQAGWLPEQNKKFVREWIEINRKGCWTIKDAVDNGYSNLEKFFKNP